MTVVSIYFNCETSGNPTPWKLWRAAREFQSQLGRVQVRFWLSRARVLDGQRKHPHADKVQRLRVENRVGGLRGEQEVRNSEQRDSNRTVGNTASLRYAEYNNFRLGSEKEQYRLEIGGYQGTAGDALNDPWYGSNLRPFSTFDRYRYKHYFTSNETLTDPTSIQLSVLANTFLTTLHSFPSTTGISIDKRDGTGALRSLHRR